MPKGDWLGEFEMCVLLAVSHLSDEAYGMRVRQEIESRTGRRVAIGAVCTRRSRASSRNRCSSLGSASRNQCREDGRASAFV